MGLEPSREDIVVRAAKVEDAPGIARVHVDTWRSAYRGIVPASFLAGLSYQTSRVRWEKFIAESEGVETGRFGRFILVAEHPADGIVAFVSAGPSRTAGTLTGTQAPPVGEIYTLYVLQAHQRRGIGRRLVGRAARRMAGQGVRSVILWALTENPYRDFYSSLGGRAGARQVQRIGGADLEETAYVWPDIGELIARTDPR